MPSLLYGHVTTCDPLMQIARPTPRPSLRLSLCSECGGGSESESFSLPPELSERLSAYKDLVQETNIQDDLMMLTKAGPREGSEP